ncbi:MAG: hypothetical protein M1840_006758 [Geoglossum simile]|nr:MAG: hypothetical protein M1840_006758 [Geoglossum simile]
MSDIATNAAGTANAADAASTAGAAATTANKDRLDYLIDTLKAYDDYINPDGRGHCHGVKRLLHCWSQTQQGLDTHICRVLYPILKAQAKSRQLANWSSTDVSTFKHIPSMATHHQVKDIHGNILAYKLCIPQTLVDNLASTEDILPPIKAAASVRGDMQHWHYCIWRKFSQEPFLSKEYRTNLPYSQTWLDANQTLFKRLSDDLRLINPECYVKFCSIQAYLPTDLQPLYGVFPGLAINQGITGDSGIHQD